jgi:hypothetical protein
MNFFMGAARVGDLSNAIGERGVGGYPTDLVIVTFVTVSLGFRGFLEGIDFGHEGGRIFFEILATSFAAESHELAFIDKV